MSRSHRADPISLLSKPVKEWIDRIPYGKVTACVQYMETRPRVLDEVEYSRKFQSEAIEAFENGNKPRAESCIEKWLITRYCDGLDEKQKSVFMKQWASEDEKMFKRFDNDFDKLYDSCEARAIEQAKKQKTRPSGPAEAESKTLKQFGGLRIGDPTSGNTISNRHQDYTSAKIEEEEDSDDGIGGTYGLKYGTQGRHDDIGLTAADHDDPRDKGKRPEARPRDSRSSNDLASVVTRKSFRGTEGVKDPIDPRYVKREPHIAGKLLRVGRVFAIFQHVEYNKRPGDSDNWSNKMQHKSRLGHEILSHVQRMIVVKEQHGFCWAIPISTYNGQGMKKKGFNKADIDAHAIVHMAGEPAGLLPLEPRMIKKAIQVVPAERGSELSAASRINFAKPHTVEHNVKFMNIGVIAPGSMPYFNVYWQAELLGASKH